MLFLSGEVKHCAVQGARPESPPRHVSVGRGQEFHPQASADLETVISEASEHGSGVVMPVFGNENQVCMTVSAGFHAESLELASQSQGGTRAVAGRA